MTNPFPAADQAEALKRDIGWLGSAVIALNGIMGAGIFALPGSLAADFGAFAPLMIILFGLPIFLIALPLAEVASFYDRTGGPVAYAREAFGPFVAFQTGWTYFVARLSAFAANVTVFAAYAATLAPVFESLFARTLLIAGVIALFAAANLASVRHAVGGLKALTILKVAPLLALALYALATQGLSQGEVRLPEFSEVETASLLILYAFVGFEHVVVLGGETKDARRTIPRAMTATLLATIALYFLVQLAYAAAMGDDDGGKAPLAAFGRTLLGEAGAVIISLAALFSIAGNCLSSAASTPRLAYALARDGLLPGWFAQVSKTRATPDNAIVFFCGLALALALTNGFALLAVVSTLARLLVYAVSLAALPIVRRRREAPPRRGVQKILAPAVLALGLAFCAFAVAQSKLDSWRVFGALLLVGAVLYAISRRAGRPAG
ncbi:MAG: APC family permease [Parvularculaceae bacterium]|nr:APC family permease [Parvularculaceae bacterium]